MHVGNSPNVLVIVVVVVVVVLLLLLLLCLVVISLVSGPAILSKKGIVSNWIFQESTWVFVAGIALQ